MDLRDVRVVEAGEHLRFPLEPSEAVRVGGEGVGEDFQGDVSAELGVGGAIDLPHAPLADEGGDVVMAEAGADGEGHEKARLLSVDFVCREELNKAGAEEFLGKGRAMRCAWDLHDFKVGHHSCHRLNVPNQGIPISN